MKGFIGGVLILAPFIFLFTILVVYFCISLTVPRQANHIAYLAGPLFGFFVSCLIWIFFLLLFLGVPCGIILLLLRLREKKV